MALARRPNGLRKNTGGCRIPTEPFSPNGLKRGWHHIPKNSLSLRAETQMAGRLGLPGLVATGATETTIAGRRSAGKGDIRHPQICTVHQIQPHFSSTYPNIPLGMTFWRDALPDSICIE